MDGRYSLLADHSLRNAIVWPLVPWTMYDVEQKRWVDIPTFAHIDVRPDEFLMLRAKNTLNIDSDKFAAMDSLILKSHAQYKRFSKVIENIPAAQPATSPATPIRPGTADSSKSPFPRRAKRKHSEEDIAAAASSSPGCIPRRSAKKRRTVAHGA